MWLLVWTRHLFYLEQEKSRTQQKSLSKESRNEKLDNIFEINAYQSKLNEMLVETNKYHHQ